MPIVNTLAVKITAETQRFNAGMKKASSSVRTFAKSNQNMGDVLKNAKNNLMAMNPALLAAGTAAVGAAVAIARLTIKTAEYAESLQKMSLRIGLSVGAIEELRFAAEQSGSSLEALTPTFRALARTSFEASQGVETYLKVFRELGVEVKDGSGKLKELDVLLEDVADGLQKTEGSTKRLALAQQILGRGATELLPLLSEGAEGIRALRAERGELGATISDKFANESAEFIDNMNRVSTIIRAGGIAIAEDFLPSFNVFLEETIRWGKEAAPKFQSGMTGFNFQVQRAQAGIIALSLAMHGQVDEAKTYFAVFRQGRDEFEAFQDQAAETKENVNAAADALALAQERAALFGDAMTAALRKAVTDTRTLVQIIKDTLAEPIVARVRGEGPEDVPQLLPTREEVQDFAEGTVTALDMLQGRAQLFFDGLASGARTSLAIAANFAEGFGDALVDSATEGRDAFASFFKDMLSRLAKAIARAILLRAVLGFAGLSSGAFFKDVGKLLVGGASGGGQMLPPSRFAMAGASGTEAMGGGSMTSPSSQAAARAAFDISIHEATPMTWATVTDKNIVPRLDQRRDELNAEGL